VVDDEWVSVVVEYVGLSVVFVGFVFVVYAGFLKLSMFCASCLVMIL